ncbi:MAG TPA: methyltransferase domain-containing protein [Terriglobia bacterium]
MPASQHHAVKEQFTRTAEAFSRYAQRDAPEILAERVEFAEPAPGEFTLDVACGPGKFVVALASRVGFARGIDLTAEMLRQARAFQEEAGVQNAAFDLGEAERLPYASGTFDLVSCQFAFHHLSQPEAALREVGRVARSDGRLLIVDSVGPEEEATSRLHNEIERLRDPSHTLTLSLSSFVALFAKQGLTIAKQTVRDRPRSFDRWLLRAGLKPSDTRYHAVRRALEESMPGDRAGFSARVSGDDLEIVHQEGMFLLTKHGR